MVWIRVLNQAVKDAKGECFDLRGLERTDIVGGARKFVTEKSEVLGLICSAAGVDCESFMTMCKEKYGV